MLRKTLITILGLLSIVVVMTFTSTGHKEDGGPVTIYLISNEIHTDLVLPVRTEAFDWENFWDPDDFESRPSEWVEFGWGDREFYQEVPTWNEFTFSVAARALFFPGEAAMHINYVEGSPENYPSSARLQISVETYRKLVESIKKQFKTKNGKLVVYGNGYDKTDNFYAAHGSFSLINTCNVWTSDRLGEAGLKHPLWSPTKYGLEFIWY